MIFFTFTSAENEYRSDGSTSFSIQRSWTDYGIFASKWGAKKYETKSSSASLVLETDVELDCGADDELVLFARRLLNPDPDFSLGIYILKLFVSEWSKIIGANLSEGVKFAKMKIAKNWNLYTKAVCKWVIENHRGELVRGGKIRKNEDSEKLKTLGCRLGAGVVPVSIRRKVKIQRGSFWSRFLRGKVPRGNATERKQITTKKIQPCESPCDSVWLKNYSFMLLCLWVRRIPSVERTRLIQRGSFWSRFYGYIESEPYLRPRKR